MATCEFSGEKCSSTITVEIAGAIMQVSPKYAHLGREIKHTSTAPSITSSNIKYSQKPKQRLELATIENAKSIIQSYFSKNNITLKQVAHNCNIKEGTLQKIMNGKIPFDVKTAQAIDKVFQLNLVEEKEISQHQNSSHSSAQKYMIDDEENSSKMKELLKDIKY